jgi:carbon-monoxide dehydrogenase medium subunit
VRNRGTLVGSIVFGANYGDIAPAVAVLDGALVVANAMPGAGMRTAAIADFIRGAHDCDLEAGDLVTAIRIPRQPMAAASCYLKHGRVAQDRATIGVAVWLAGDAGGACHAVRIAIGGLRHPVVRASAVETILQGQRLTPALMQEAGALAAATLGTQTDELASADYRSQLLRVYLPQALASAVQRL